MDRFLWATLITEHHFCIRWEWKHNWMQHRIRSRTSWQNTLVWWQLARNIPNISSRVAQNLDWRTKCRRNKIKNTFRIFCSYTFYVTAHFNMNNEVRVCVGIPWSLQQFWVHWLCFVSINNLELKEHLGIFLSGGSFLWISFCFIIKVWAMSY